MLQVDPEQRGIGLSLKCGGSADAGASTAAGLDAAPREVEETEEAVAGWVGLDVVRLV
ncbi:MAG: hypothetical protein AB7N71_04165 [Phycisphaerae bacterium]